MAYERLVRMLKQGATVWNEFIKNNMEITDIDLRWADLSYSDLKWVDLSRADLRNANLIGADLSNANLSWAYLDRADLSNTNLSGANLSGANLSEAYLSMTILDRAVLNNALIKFSEFQKTIHNGVDTEKIKLIYEGIPFDDKNNRIIKSIEFPPEYKQAGISILTYFSNIVNQKYPEIKVKVIIEQEKNKVRMIIETPEGEKETIEKVLEEYGLVVTGRMPFEQFLDNKIEIVELKNQLKFVSVQLESNKEIQELYKIRNMELVSENRNLHNIIEKQHNDVDRLLSLVSDSLSHSNDAVKSLLEKYNTNDAAMEVLYLIKNKLKIVSNTQDEESRNVLVEAEKKKSGIIGDIAKSIVSGAGGKVLGELVLKSPDLLSAVQLVISQIHFN